MDKFTEDDVVDVRYYYAKVGQSWDISRVVRLRNGNEHRQDIAVARLEDEQFIWRFNEVWMANAELHLIYEVGLAVEKQDEASEHGYVSLTREVEKQ